MDSDTVKWCNLPKDLIVMVAVRLGTRTDILRLRAVCSPWRSSLPDFSRNNHSPLFSVKLPLPIALNPKHRGYFTLTESTVYYLEQFGYENPNGSPASQEGWMVKVEEAKSGKIRIFDTLLNFPWLGKGRHRLSSKVLNLLNVRVFELKNACNLQFINVGIDYKTDDCDELKYVFKKVVMSSVPLCTENNNGDCAILTLDTEGNLGYFKSGDNQWTMIDDDGDGKSEYDDILYRNDRFYAVDSKGKMIVIDSSLNVSVIESPVHCDVIRDGVTYQSLVESNGDLYVVNKYFDWYLDPSIDEDEDYITPSCLIRFKVHKLNGEEKEWVQVSSLGDQAFFIGADCCFAVSARKFPFCEGNCIYFTDDEFIDGDRNGHLGYNVGIFELEEDTSNSLSDPPRAILGFSGHPQPGSSIMFLQNHLPLDVESDMLRGCSR